MRTIRKDVAATIQPGEDDAEAPNGSFHIILSDATKDRDGEQLHPGEWETPLPEHITMDRDHEMSVAGTVGSGVPALEDDGALHVRGTYSSLPMAQDVRTLVNEGHIRTTSVAFLRKSDTDEKGAKTITRELLNGAFVAVPANPNALVLSSKAVKEGRRNNAGDAKAIQAIHDHATDLGAGCADAGKAARKDVGDSTGDDDPRAIAQGVDAAIDQVLDLLSQVDLTTLPEPAQQAVALLQAADVSCDNLLAALGVVDPDDDSTTAGAADAAKAASAASAAGLEALPDRIAELRERALGALSDIYAKTGA